MWMIGPIGFAAPWLLLGLIALPILWILLRAVPPAPIRRRFPGVALLLGLTDDETQTDRTPWWLLLLRMIAIAAAIIGFAGPVLNPDVEESGDAPLLVLIDGTWADAPDWARRMDRIDALLSDASLAGRETAVISLTNLLPDYALPFRAADAWRSELAGIAPMPWAPPEDDVLAFADSLDGEFDIYWMSDGLDYPWRGALTDALLESGSLTVFETTTPVIGLRPARFEDGEVRVGAIRSRALGASETTLVAHGLDPSGAPRQLATAQLAFAEGEAEAEVALSLPAELRDRITRFEIGGRRSAGAVSLTDDTLQRREVAILSARDAREGLQLLSPTHYLEQALVETADLINGTISEIALANPDVIVLADIVALAEDERSDLEDWVRGGGLLLRFAGPRMAASDISREAEDGLMPVRLRAGGRTVGGAMSWGEPKALRAFSPDSPFFGLAVPDDVTVSSQVVAEPDPTLSERTIAALTDGTPLVTRKRMGDGQVVLFHVTANAEWSSLPLSGLFVRMLDRLAVSSRGGIPSAEDLAGTVWTPDTRLTAFGEIEDAGNQAGVAGERLATAIPGPELPPGLYSGEERRIAVNVVSTETDLVAATWPDTVTVEGISIVEETPLKGLLLSLALIALMADILATLMLSGRLTGPRAGAVGAVLIAAASFAPSPATAQDEQDLEAMIAAATEVTLAYVVTGNAAVDQTSEAGLAGLSDKLFRRTSVEPSRPTPVDLETDDLSLFPFLYWPVTPDQPRPSSEAYGKLNRYLRTGGMILFDTRDAGLGGAGPNSRKLQELALPLDIPPLEEVPEDHVLTRTFYLLQDFPGRYASRQVWVEASPPDAERAEGMPFRNLNDNVTPVVIGGNDWAAAWAIDDMGLPLFPVGRGFTGERQREIAYRFGINLVMHVLTGNYKSDQVHVPALLERLGQ